MNRTTVKKAHRKFAHNDNKCWQSRIKYKYEKRWNFFFVEFVNGHMMFYTIYWSITIKFRQMCSDLWLPKWWSSRQPIHFTAVSSFCMFLALSICRVVQISVFFCLAVYFLRNQCCLLFFHRTDHITWTFSIRFISWTRTGRFTQLTVDDRMYTQRQK